MERQTAKDQIEKELTKKAQRNKTLFEVRDLIKLLPKFKSREAKKIIQEMIEEEILIYWSSGSTTKIGLKKFVKQG